MKKSVCLIAILLFCGFVVNTFAQNTETATADKDAMSAEDISGSKTLTDEEYAKMAGGCVAPSLEEKARLDATAIKVEPNDIVPINELGLQRINEERLKKGKKPLTSKQANDLFKKKQDILNSDANPEQIKAIDEQ